MSTYKKTGHKKHVKKEQEKEICYLAVSILGPGILAVIIAAGSPTHNCCSFFPELLMIMIPGAYCFYALRSILSIKFRSAILVFAVMAALGVLTIAKTVPVEKTEEEKETAKTELLGNQKKPNVNSISQAFKSGF